jgi:hypothetical protein
MFNPSRGATVLPSPFLHNTTHSLTNEAQESRTMMEFLSSHGDCVPDDRHGDDPDPAQGPEFANDGGA